MIKRKRGENPVFYADDIEGLKGVECWPIREEEQKSCWKMSVKVYNVVTVSIFFVIQVCIIIINEMIIMNI